MVVLGGHVWLPPGGHAWLLLGGGHAWFLQGGHAWLLWGVRGCSRGACLVALGGRTWDTMRYGDTVNERAVCILLECILVTCKIIKKADCAIIVTQLNKVIIGPFTHIQDQIHTLWTVSLILILIYYLLDSCVTWDAQSRPYITSCQAPFCWNSDVDLNRASWNIEVSDFSVQTFIKNRPIHWLALENVYLKMCQQWPWNYFLKVQNLSR